MNKARVLPPKHSYAGGTSPACVRRSRLCRERATCLLSRRTRVRWQALHYREQDQWHHARVQSSPEHDTFIVFTSKIRSFYRCCSPANRKRVLERSQLSESVMVRIPCEHDQGFSERSRKDSVQLHLARRFHHVDQERGRCINTTEHINAVPSLGL
jgi:hypothetical protein